MLAIGNLSLSSPLILAPLAGVSDLPFRLISRRHGCELAFVEMTSTHALARRNPRTLRMAESVPGDRPLGIQLLGSDTESLRGALEVVNAGDYAVVDFNAACPVKKVVRRGEGAALMREPRKLKELLRVIVDGVCIPVTVKIRAGWDAGSVNARDVALHAQEAGISAIFVHGRTRAQGYSGTVDYRVIEEVKRAVDIPIIGSGDVLTPELARKMLDETGCDGLVVARGAMGNPWIFGETETFLRTGHLPPRPDLAQMFRIVTEHMDLTVNYYGEERGIKIFRKFLIWYTRGLGNVKHLRGNVSKVGTVKEARGLIEDMSEAAQGRLYPPAVPR